MGTLITIWFAGVGIYYLCVAGLRLAVQLPAAVVFVLTLPAMPFIVAYRNRADHPIQTKTICWLWSTLYTAVLIACFIG